MKLKAVIIFIVLLVISCDEYEYQSHCDYSFNESEAAIGANTNTDPASSEDFGIKMSPGCKVTINGYLVDGNHDYFKVNTGTAKSIAFTVKWIPQNSSTLSLFVTEYSTSSVFQISYEISGTIYLVWKVDVQNFDRYIGLAVLTGTYNGNYSITIEGF